MGLALQSLEAETQDADQDIGFGGEVIGKVEQIRLEASSNDPSRLILRLGARINALAGILDRVLGARENFTDSCRTRLYWSGSTSIESYGENLDLSSRVTYESWTCIRIPFTGKYIKTRNLQATKTVKWRLFIEPGRVDQLKINPRVMNVKSVATWIENLLDLRVQESVVIPLPAECGRCSCEKIVADHNLSLRSVRFENAGNNAVRVVRVVVLFSVPRDLTDFARCFNQ